MQTKNENSQFSWFYMWNNISDFSEDSNYLNWNSFNWNVNILEQILPVLLSNSKERANDMNEWPNFWYSFLNAEIMEHSYISKWYCMSAKELYIQLHLL